MLSRYSSGLARSNTWTCLSCSVLARTSQALIKGPPHGSSSPIDQRKHSSSKASSSAKDEPRAITTPSESPAKDAKPALKEGAEKRTSSRPSKRKTKEAIIETVAKTAPESSLNLPSVPSTNHIHHIDIQTASFFSQHRPMALNVPIPPEYSTAAFSSIFDVKPPPKNKASDVIYTISSAVDTLENAASGAHNQQSEQVTQEEVDLRQAVTKESVSNASQTTHNLDIPAKTLHLNLQEMVKIFRPYMKPPPPVPMGSALEMAQPPSRNTETQTQDQANSQPAATQKSYTTTLTIHEITQPNGQKSYKTHTTPIVEEPSASDEGSVRYLPPAPRNQPFLGRMRERQLQYLDRVGGQEVWSAISVKRQRKLKMKKHKYKKLMKRTKNLRRRLDRT